MSKKSCVLYDRDCIDCGECMFCDLDPLKICDNCGKCLKVDEYATIKIDSVDGKDYSTTERKPSPFSGKKFTINKK